MIKSEPLVQLRAAARQWVKQAYLAIPFKKRVFEALRPYWTPPAPILTKLYFRGTFEVDVPGGQKLWLNHNCSGVETSIYWKGLLGEWEKTSLGTWLQLARQSKVIVDVGANSGLYALSADRKSVV